MRNTRRTVPRGLYLITPDVSSLADLRAAVEPVLAYAAMIQLRCKSEQLATRQAQADWLRTVTTARSIPLIVNDDLKLALEVAADGVHLGREDGSIEAARLALGDEALIGASCYDDFAIAEMAWQSGADYVAFGAVFPSPTKPDAVCAPLSLFQRARDAGMHSVAIGGITPETIGSVVDAGADMAAVICGIYEATDRERAAARCAAAFNSN